MAYFVGQVAKGFLKSCEQISYGRLQVETPEGLTLDFGNSGPEAHLKIHDWSAISAAAARGDVGFGQAYIEGLWDSDDVELLTMVSIENMTELKPYAYGSAVNRIKHRFVDRVLRANSKAGAARNIKSHYDVGNEFYMLWLDPSMTYSSAIFTPEDHDLGRGQYRKYDRVLSQLKGESEHVLEIGCGWGGFAERAAENGLHVTGLTISPSQKGFADARLDGRADILLQDYRDVQGTFDKIVSIEMIEAVGERYWPSYFGTLKARLAEGGQAVIQAITVPDDYFETYRKGSDFIRQHIFPGGMLLSDEQIKLAARNAGLAVEESFAFGKDYALTCRTWRERMMAQQAKIANLGYGEKFLRSWRFYLDICAAAFEVGHTDVVQVRLVHA